MECSKPDLFHTIRGQRSILALLVSGDHVFAGTQGGDLQVWSLTTFDLLHNIRAHRGSLLNLFVSANGKLLFSSGGDSIVNVWCTRSFSRLYSIYSRYDVGDIFCVVYSSKIQTVYMGSQNTSIQWFDLSKKDLAPPPDPSFHPLNRNHDFFDSKGSNGISTPRSASPSNLKSLGGQDLEIDREDVVQYAHYGYVTCMLLADSISAHKGCIETLVSGGGDGAIRLWCLDPKSGSITDPISLETDDDSILSIALDGTLLYAGQLGGNIYVWDLDTKQMIRKMNANSADVLTLAFGYDLLFCGGSDGKAKIFDSRHQSTSSWDAHNGLMLASAVASFNGRELYVTGGNDGCIEIWDFSNCFERPLRRAPTSNEELVCSLERLICYRTISSNPEFAQDCRRGASFLRNLFKRFGAESELLRSAERRNPVVYARFRGKYSGKTDCKSILYYGHYDVVPADGRNKAWRTDPFQMQGFDGYLYGRGVSDNKGPILAALYAVADIFMKKELECDVVFLIEGEEECGSRGFQRTVNENKELIGKIDWILLANSYWLTDDIPCLTYGLRGVIHATVEVTSDQPDLHSGVDGSQLISEPLKDLVAVLASLTDFKGKISIPGFYDSIPPISTAENERFDRISNTLIHKNPSLGDVDSLASSFKARWREPSLTIHRIDSSGPPSNSTIISRTAKADISIRLVPDQTSSGIRIALERALRTVFDGLRSANEMSVHVPHQAEPWLGDPNNTIFRTLDKAITEVWSSPHSDDELSEDIPLGDQNGHLVSPALTSSPRDDHRPTTPSTSSDPSTNISSPTAKGPSHYHHPATSSTLSSPTLSYFLPILPTPPTSEPTASTKSPSFSSPPSSSALSSAPVPTQTQPSLPSNPKLRSQSQSQSQSQKPTIQPLYIREGGSIPAIRFLETAFSAPAAHFPCGQASDAAHLDNERLRLLNLYQAREVFRRVFGALGKEIIQ